MPGTRSGTFSTRWLLAFGCFCVALVNAQEQSQAQPTDASNASVASLGADLHASTAFPAPSASASAPPSSTNKNSICALDFEQFAEPLELIRVLPERNPLALADTASVYPRILCFMYTIAPWHGTRAQAVVDTWGQRCHKLIVFSNETHNFVPSRVDLRTGQAAFTKADHAQAFSQAYAQAHGLGNVSSNVEVVVLDAPVDYEHLWQRHRAGLRYISEHFREDFDWFYKADDDSYIILENLREYLKRPEILMQWMVQPIHLGHRFNLTPDRIDFYVQNTSFASDFYDRFHAVVFNSGGAGYAMNGLYLDQLVKTLDDKTCFSDAQSQTMPEDAATALCMMWHNVTPWDTRDVSGRERWHTSNPIDVFDVSLDDPEHWYIQFHRDIGGVQSGKDCCAPDSIAYHYMTPERMYHMERQLYFCRSDFQELDDFNREYSLAISNRVLVTPVAAEA